MKEFCPYCQNDPVTHMQQKEICGMCEMETKVAKRKITRADQFRAMTDEELAIKFSEIERLAIMSDRAWFPSKWLDWLKQEVE